METGTVPSMGVSSEESKRAKRVYRLTKPIDKKKKPLLPQQLSILDWNYPRHFQPSTEHSNTLMYEELISRKQQCRQVIKKRIDNEDVLFYCGTLSMVCLGCERRARFLFDSWLWTQSLNKKELVRFCQLAYIDLELRSLREASELIFRHPDTYLEFYQLPKYNKDTFSP